jgi:hypothetical protein
MIVIGSMEDTARRRPTTANADETASHDVVAV